MSREFKGTYCGIRRRLRGSRALMQPAPGGWRVQFDDRRHKESHYWWYFPRSDFRNVFPLGELPTGLSDTLTELHKAETA